MWRRLQYSRLSVSIPDLSPAHGESPDEVLRRRHGDKEVRISTFECVACADEWKCQGGTVQSAFLLQKILEEQRRLKREQEEADTASRRHTSIVPTHHQFITNERFGDLLNITDNTERRKSGVEVRHRNDVTKTGSTQQTSSLPPHMFFKVQRRVDLGVPVSQQTSCTANTSRFFPEDKKTGCSSCCCV